ncbi:MAG: family 20 glycosylhydrolase [Bacteroidales bacterium]|nr:family 20 glycosylhydrolase [Bacteroidales bacterium]
MVRFFLLIALFSGITICSYGQISIIPQPAKEECQDGNFRLNSSCAIYTNEKSCFSLNYLRERLVKATGFPFLVSGQMPESNYIALILDSDIDLPEEGYKLEADHNGVSVKASSSSGLFYGVQTLLQLLPPSVYSGNINGTEEWSVRCVKIYDKPRFQYRGLMMDVSRTFFNAENVKKHLEWLAHHKINKFHWHLTDDNGWRIEIKRYPLLTEKGAWRGDDELLRPAYGSGPGRYGGYYTQEEIRDIVAFAAERFIEVIPEIELPGHSRAVIVTYPETACSGRDTTLSAQGEERNVWCAGKESNFTMLDNILKEVARLFPSKYIHIGGDEVNFSNWQNCPDCKALMKKEDMKEAKELLGYFTRKVESILAKYGKHLAGWDEILEGGELDKNSMIYARRGVDKGIESAKKGYPTIMQPCEFCYLDMKQSRDERGQNWAGIVTLDKSYSFEPIIDKGLSPKEAALIKGVQGGLWSELLIHPQRFAEYQIYPRIAAIAEAGWSEPGMRNWEEFNNRLGRVHYDRLFQMGINFRVPPPEVVYENGSIQVKPPYCWSVVRYSCNDRGPDKTSPIYKGEIFTDSPLKFRFATFFNDILRSPVVRASNVNPVYQKIPFIIETSLSFTKGYPVTNLMDNNPVTHAMTENRLRKGDYITFVFDKGVKTKRIFVNTGIPLIDLYYVTDGYVEFSYDGINYISGGDLVFGNAVIEPERPVKSIRIMVNSPNDAHTAAFQDLIIE